MGLPLYIAPVESDIPSRPSAKSNTDPANFRSPIRRTDRRRALHGQRDQQRAIMLAAWHARDEFTSPPSRQQSRNQSTRTLSSSPHHLVPDHVPDYVTMGRRPYHFEIPPPPPNPNPPSAELQDVVTLTDARPFYSRTIVPDWSRLTPSTEHEVMNPLDAINVVMDDAADAVNRSSAVASSDTHPSRFVFGYVPSTGSERPAAPNEDDSPPEEVRSRLQRALQRRNEQLRQRSQIATTEGEAELLEARAHWYRNNRDVLEQQERQMAQRPVEHVRHGVGPYTRGQAEPYPRRRLEQLLFDTAEARHRLEVQQQRPRLGRRRNENSSAAISAATRLDAPRVRHVDGLGDRDRSLSPEGDGVWDILQSTLTPDPQPPSVGSSFASTVSAAPSQTNESNSVNTSRTTPDEDTEPPCDPVGDNSGSGGEGDHEEQPNALSRHFAPASPADRRPWVNPRPSWSEVYGEPQAADENEAGPELTQSSSMRRPGLQVRPSWADIVAEPQPVADENGENEQLEILNGMRRDYLDAMRQVVRGLVSREDVPDEWWAEVGLTRSMSWESPNEENRE